MATASLPKSGAVTIGYNFTSTWEQNAPLTEQQHHAIAGLSKSVAELPFPPNLSQDQISGINASVPMSDSVEESAAIDAVLVNTHQFYKWFTDVESAIKSETEEKYNFYVSALVERIQTCDGILNQVDDTLNLFDELQMLHRTVATKTKALHDACDRLLLEKQRLVDFAEALRSKLNYFDELENELQTSIEFIFCGGKPRYVESNPQYAESGVYLVKFRQLQSRALGTICPHVVSVLKGASSQVQASIRDSGSGKTSFSEGVEPSVMYVCFKAAASELKPLLEEIESRPSRKEYVQVLSECHRLYCEQRLYLIKV